MQEIAVAKQLVFFVSQSFAPFKFDFDKYTKQLPLPLY
jgi:hypothetical protein